MIIYCHIMSFCCARLVLVWIQLVDSVRSVASKKTSQADPYAVTSGMQMDSAWFCTWPPSAKWPSDQAPAKTTWSSVVQENNELYSIPKVRSFQFQELRDQNGPNMGHFGSPGYLFGPQFTPLQSDARCWAARVWTLGFEARHPRGAAVTAVVMAELVELVELGSIGPSCRCDTMWSMCAMYCLILTWYLVSPLQL